MPLAAEKAFEAEIGHDRRDQGATREPAVARQARRDQRHQLVAVENDAALVGDDQPVGVAVERDADIGAPRQHLAPHLLGREAPHSRLMFSPSGATPIGNTSAPSSQSTVGATL